MIAGAVRKRKKEETKIGFPQNLVEMIIASKDISY